MHFCECWLLLVGFWRTASCVDCTTRAKSKGLYAFASVLVAAVFALRSRSVLRWHTFLLGLRRAVLVVFGASRPQLEEHVGADELGQTEVVLPGKVGRQVATNQQVRTAGELACALGWRQHWDKHFWLLHLNDIVCLRFIVNAPSWN